MAEPGSEAELRLLQQDLYEWSRDSTIFEGLFLASSALASEVQASSPEVADRQARLYRALSRYRARMSGRCTPFGIFAGWSTGSFASTTALRLPPRQHYARHTRLDCGFLLGLVDRLCANKQYRDQMDAYVNPTLFRIGNELRYFQIRVTKGFRRYYLMSVPVDSALTDLLEAAKGHSSVRQLKGAVLSGATAEEVSEYVDQALDAQLLVADLSLTVTGNGPLEDLIRDLERCNVRGREYGALESTRHALGSLDDAGLGAAPTRYRDIIVGLDGLAELHTPDRMFQVDLAKPAEQVTLDGRITEELLEGARALHCLFARRGSALSSFCDRFSTRYGSASVPLLEALDDDIGVGFRFEDPVRDAPLLDGLPPLARRAGQTISLDGTSLLLQRLLYDAQAAGSSEIALHPKSVEACRDPDAPPLPDAFHITATLLPVDGAGLNGARIHHVSGPSGARFLGRFCYADRALMEGVQRHIIAEEDLDDAAYCELIHLPQGRLGNVIVRPPFRSYELPILSKSQAPEHRQIKLADLVVSVSNGRLELFAPNIGKRVIPRLTSAHNAQMPGLAVYRFLAALQSEGVAAMLAWDWRHLARLPYLPRVLYGTTVLAVQTWYIDHTELKGLEAKSATERFARVQRLRAARRLTRFVGVVTGDQVLPVDLDNIASVEGCLAIVRGGYGISICELYPGPSGTVVQGPEGGFAHEVVIPFVRCDRQKGNTKVVQRIGPLLRTEHKVKEQVRRRPPGSEWLYVKIYCGDSAAEDVLLVYLEPLVQRLMASKTVSHWFFVRYSDDGPHLRVRLRCEASGDAMSIACGALEKTLNDRASWRIVLDTYEREIERYGGMTGIDACEAMFHTDTVAVLALIRRAPPDSEERWLLTISGVNALLDDFGLSLEDKAQLMAVKAGLVGHQVGVTGDFLHAVKSRYRRVRKSVMQAISMAVPDGGAIAQRSARNAPLIQVLRELEAKGDLDGSVGNIVPSLVHMHVNRMLLEPRILQEAILYRYMALAYESIAARVRAVQPTETIDASRSGEVLSALEGS